MTSGGGIQDESQTAQSLRVPLVFGVAALLLFLVAPFLPDWDYVSPDPGHDIAFSMGLGLPAVVLGSLLLLFAVASVTGSLIGHFRQTPRKGGSHARRGWSP